MQSIQCRCQITGQLIYRFSCSTSLRCIKRIIGNLIVKNTDLNPRPPSRQGGTDGRGLVSPSLYGYQWSDQKSTYRADTPYRKRKKVVASGNRPYQTFIILSLTIKNIPKHKNHSTFQVSGFCMDYAVCCNRKREILLKKWNVEKVFSKIPLFNSNKNSSTSRILPVKNLSMWIFFLSLLIFPNFTP